MPRSVVVVKTLHVYGHQPPTGAPASNAADGLRAVAVGVLLMGVLVGKGFPGTPAATSVLLVLTGYLVTAHMARESRHTGRLELRAMWQRRSVRWVPVLWITLAAIAAGSVLGVWPTWQVRELPGETVAALLNMSNWWRISSPERLADGVACPEAGLWLTSVVEQSVAVWSVLFCAAFVAHRRGWAFVVPATLAVGGGVSLWFTTRVTADPLVASMHTGVRFAEVLMGATLAWTWRRRGLRGPRRPDLRRTVLLLWPAAALVLVLASVLAGPDSAFWSHGGYLLSGLAAMGVVAGAVTVGSLRTVLEWRPLVVVGRRAGVVLFVAWPTYLAVPNDWGPVVGSVVVLMVCAISMLLVDRLPVGRQFSDAARSQRLVLPALAATGAD